MDMKTLNALYKVLSGDGTNVTAKPRFKPQNRPSGFPEVLPEQAGVRSEGLLRMFARLSADSGIRPHSVVVLRGGRLIAQADWKPYSAQRLHVSHSLSKSVVGMAVGIAIKEGYLSEDEKISDIFPEQAAEESPVIVRHLLTMSGGVRFNEAGAMVSGRWIRDFLASERSFEPGSRFEYNSINTYMLSAAICKRTGMSLSEYLRRRLFTPMGIRDFYWEKSPEGYEKGGWGLYMSVYDYARLGQLYLDGGVWNGVQLVPREWVKKSLAPGVTEEYGCHIWRIKGGYDFNGMFGQNVFVFPGRKMVIAMTAGSTNLFPESRTLDIVTDFAADSRNFSAAPIKNFQYRNAALLRNALDSAEFGKPLTIGGGQSFIERLRGSVSAGAAETSPEAVRLLDGVAVEFEKNRAGLAPLLLQLMNGIPASGIEKVTFEVGGTAARRSEIRSGARRYIGSRPAGDGSAGGRLVLRFEGGGKRVAVPVGFGGKAERFDHVSAGGSFAVGVTGVLAADEDGAPVLRVTLCFLETSCAKILKFIFDGGGVTLKMRESPQLYGALDEMTEVYLGKRAGKAAGAILETEAADRRLKSLLEPALKGKIVSGAG